MIKESRFEMATGDVNSKEMGTGARANGGKARWDLMPMSQVARLVANKEDLEKVKDQVNHAMMLMQIGGFQAGQCRSQDLLMMAVAYNWSIQERVNGSMTLMKSLENVIRVWEYGLIKYSEFNWATGMNWTVPIGCMVRHTQYHIENDLYDDESKEMHSAHVVCNAMMLEHYNYYWEKGDDRSLFAFPKDSEGSEATEDTPE